MVDNNSVAKVSHENKRSISFRNNATRTNSSTFGDEDIMLKATQRGNRRRITNINPNLKLADVVSSRPSTANSAASGSNDMTDLDDPNYFANRRKLKADKSYKFKCGGAIEKAQTLTGKSVEWSATFSKPMEQLIYPSLQRFDNEEYKQKKKFYEKLHGRTLDGLMRLPSYSSNSISSHPVSIENYDDSIEVDYYTNQSKLDAHLQVNHQKLFLITPNWTAKITDTEKRDESNNNIEAMTVSISDEIEQKGESYLRKNLKESYVTKIRKENEALLNNTVTEISVDSFQIKMQNIRKKASDIPQVVAYDENSAENLYATMVKLHNAIDTKSVRPIKLSETSNEENAFAAQTKELKGKVPIEHEHLHDGILYYRFRNHLNQIEQEEKKAFDRERMNNREKSLLKKVGNTFALRLLTKHRSSVSTGGKFDKNINAERLLENDESELEDGLIPNGSESVKTLAELNLNRINRAIQSKNIGAAVAQSDSNAAQLPIPVHYYDDNDAFQLQQQQFSSTSTANRMNFTSKVKQLSMDSKKLQQKYAEPVPLSPGRSKRIAQDNLLLLQLDAGLFPETYIKPAMDPKFLTIDLSNYGIGDTRGLCVGKCLKTLSNLQSVGLSDNRLTSLSIPTIIDNLSRASVMHLDLSFNSLRDKGARALAQYFKTFNAVHYLDISHCGINCNDIQELCKSFLMQKNSLEELYISGNKIAVDGTSSLCTFLSSKNCFISSLDMAWNNMCEQGAISFASAIANNSSLTNLNIASNSINDLGAQRIAASFPLNRALVSLNMAQNGISDGTCFVLAQTLKGHPSIRTLDLNLNPLGEAGARSIFRTILRGLRCFITMRGCSYKENPRIFNYSYPTLKNPYILDLSEPYQAAVLAELMTKVIDDPVNCEFDTLSYREMPKTSEVSFNLIEQSKKMIIKSTGQVWIPPPTGILKFSFHQNAFVPTLANAATEQAFNILQIIVEKGRTEDDRKQWMTLLCQDLYFTTEQAQSMIDRFTENMTIGTGGLTRMDVIKSLWKYLIDTENIFDFLFRNADLKQRRDFAYAIGIKRFKFNWVNPTSFWNLNLADSDQRSIMMQLIAINNKESEYSHMQAHRGDTSQSGNWFNFRNEKFTSTDGVKKDFCIDKDFLKNLPLTGTVEFDYVSTTRPVFMSSSSTKTNNTLSASSADAGDEVLIPPGGSSDPNDTVSQAQQQRIDISRMLITDDEFFSLLAQLGLSSRHKISAANALFVLMDLQLACSKYYFSIVNMITIMDAFTDEWTIQSKVFVCLFSRCLELHKLDIILRTLSSKAYHDVIRRLGYLNVLNPLKIAADYMIDLKYLDNRILLISLMELASVETADQILEDLTTELPMASLYGSYTRALNETRPEIMRFTYCDFGVRTKNVNWTARKELLKKFLV
eukprot:gene5255-7303_t